MSHYIKKKYIGTIVHLLCDRDNITINKIRSILIVSNYRYISTYIFIWKLSE